MKEEVRYGKRRTRRTEKKLEVVVPWMQGKVDGRAESFTEPRERVTEKQLNTNTKQQPDSETPVSVLAV